MKRFWLIILVVAFWAVPFLGYAQENIFYMSQSKESQGIASLKKNADKIDILAPQFFSVGRDMKISGKIDAQLAKVISHLPAQAGKKLKVMPLITNSGFNQNIIHKLLLSKPSQEAVITGLVYIAKKNNYIGWQFDFENISYLDKDLYSAFVEKTALALHKNNLILSVAAVSRDVDYEDTDAFKNWGGVFDYARLAKAVDFISLMTYDDPDSVGPVASLPFINNVLAYVKDKIPADKLSFGIPLYNWGWRADLSKKITANGTYDGLLYIKKNFRHTLSFSEILGAACLTYSWNNKQYQIWYQNKQTFQDKLDIISQNNFRGFSAWVLGVEDPTIWSTLDKRAK